MILSSKKLIFSGYSGLGPTKSPYEWLPWDILYQFSNTGVNLANHFPVPKPGLLERHVRSA
jgi:hypothetical protein